MGLKKHHLLSFLFISFGIVNQLEAQPHLRLKVLLQGEIGASNKLQFNIQ